MNKEQKEKLKRDTEYKVRRLLNKAVEIFEDYMEKTDERYDKTKRDRQGGAPDSN